MGQQQLLLLVLSIVLVGLAVVVGISAFQENQRKTRLELRINRVTDIAARIQAWAQTPAAMGGGSQTDGELNWAGFKPVSIGIEARQTGRDNYEWQSRADGMGCFLMFVNTTQNSRLGTLFHLHMLNDACDYNSYRDYPRLYLSGEGLESMRWRYPDDAN